MADLPEYIREDPEPIHGWFGLSGNSYMVVPRSALQSMPREWQLQFIGMMEDLRSAFGHLAADQGYKVTLPHGQIDPLRDYERGRRRLKPRGEPCGDEDS